jgi:hypothetical protein
VGRAGDTDDGAHVISPFGIGQGRVRVEHLDHTGFVTRSPLGVPGCILVNSGCCLAHLFGALVQRGLVVFDLGDQEGAGRCGFPECFLTVHGIDGQQRLLLKPEWTQQSLDRRDLVGLLVPVEMRQHQGSVRRKPAENMRGLAVVEIVSKL